MNVQFKKRFLGQTEIDTIEWTVPDFIKLLENKTTRELHTEKLMDPANKFESRLQLKMRFLGRGKEIIEIYYLSPTPLCLKSELYRILSDSYENGECKDSIKTTEYHTVEANKWQYLTTLHERDNDSEYNLPCGNLKLSFDFFYIPSEKKFGRFNIPQLSSDFEYLLNSGSFSDVTIKSAEQSEYKVHKAVLTSRSPVLKAHFEHNTTECHTNIVESPLESEVLGEVLTFVYSDKAPRVDEIPEKLLSAADYYQLSGLKILCEEAVHKKLTVENAIETLQLADLHSANTLKQLTLEFIKGQSNVITKTEGWSKLKDVELIKRILEYIVADDSDADIWCDYESATE